jgi:diguanylate cyclase (GGDEF)-like protein/PAS domain S-box-containing protein
MTTDKPRILAIDDVPANLLTLGAALAADFDLQIATSGAMGIALARESAPDLILLDIMMPGMDGFETCQQLKADPALMQIPVIFVSALSEFDSEEKGLLLGAADYMTKPVNIAIARQRIRNLLDRERFRKEIESQRDRLNVEIAERKRTESKIKLAASVFAHAREGIMITELDGTIIEVNEAFSRITGYQSDEVIGRNPRILSSGRQEKAYYTAMWCGLIDKGHWYGEVWNRRKNGEVYAEMQNISTVRNEQGEAQYFVALFSDITVSKKHQTQLEHLAHYDALTKLPNRMLLTDRLQQAMAHAERRKQPLTVAFIDLDGFKTINDTHGHEIGDQLLVTVANRMHAAVREGDTLARIGGDEFVAVLVDLADDTASAPALQPTLARLLAAASQPFHYNGLILQVSASIGVTFYPQAGDVTGDQLIQQGDQAMYQAKKAGKNCCHAFDAANDR